MKKSKGTAWIDVRKLRVEREWLQEDAARKLGITRAYLSTIENKKCAISLHMVEKIIEVFGVKFEDFYEPTPPEKPE